MIKNIKNFLLYIIKVVSPILTGLKLHRLIPFRRKIYDFLFARLWTGGDIIEIQGSKMYINPKEPDPMMRQTLQTYALSSAWEEDTTKLFEKLVKKGDVIVDMGANVGYFTLLSAKLTGKDGRVFSFEPSPKNFEYLSKNIKINNYANVTAEQKAVSDSSGKIKLFLCPYDTGHHTIKQQEGIEAYRLGRGGEVSSINIDAVTLDEYMKNKSEKVDVMKIDVEGAEALAFSGMKETLTKNRNIKIFLEFFPLLIEKMGSSPENFVNYLLREFNVFVIGHDYVMEKFNKNYLKISSYKELADLTKGYGDHLNLFLTRSDINI
jgi:FkbM family methyltransferase